MTPQQWHDQVGRPIRDRREFLRLSVRAAAKRAGFSEGLWRQLESGERVLAKGVTRTVSPKAETAAAACRAIEWTDDSIDLLLAGRPPRIARGGKRVTPVAAVTDHIRVIEERLAVVEEHLGISPPSPRK